MWSERSESKEKKGLKWIVEAVYCQHGFGFICFFILNAQTFSLIIPTLIS
jgi:hypothetical protein